MAVLPSDADVQLPVPNTRRQPVGSYDTSAFSAGVRQLGQGVEHLGQGLSTYAFDQARTQNNLQDATAQSNYLTSHVNTMAQLPTITDPTQLDQVKQQNQTNLDTAASQIQDPVKQQEFKLRYSPQVAEANAQVDAHGRTLVTGQQIADTAQDGITTTNAALLTDDPSTQAALLDAHNKRIAALQQTGAVTAPQAQNMRETFVNQYARAKAENEIQKGEATGDTTRLQKTLDDLQLGQPGNAPATAVNTSIPPEGRALLDTIAGPESGRSGYNAQYPGGTFQGFTDHPRQASQIPNGPDAGRTSDAAGRYQFLSSTWDMEAKKLGLKDFSPANQDAAAWDLAQTTYKQKTGGDLTTALKSKDPATIAGVSSALSGQWSSLPGGHQPGTTSDTFTAAFQNNLSNVASAALPNAPNARANAFVIGDSLGAGVQQAIGAPGVTTVGRQPSDVLADIKALDPQQVAGKTIVLSGGSSNDPKNGPDITASQVDALVAKGVDPKDIRILGVGDRSDFASNAVNKKLSDMARIKGSTFVPIDTSSLSSDHVHPTNYAGIASSALGKPVGVGAQAPSQPSVYEYLKPDERAQLAIRTQNSIDQIQRRTVQAANQQTALDMTDIKGWTRSIVDGTAIPDPVWDQQRQKYANSPNPMVQNAFANADAVRNKLSSYRGQTPSQIAADVANQTSQLSRNGMDDRAQGVLLASQSYLKTFQKQVSEDPLTRAAQDGVVGNVQPLDPTQPGFSDAVQTRMAQAEHVGDYYHQAPKYLLPEEKTALKTIATTGGQPMIDAASGIVHAMGSKAGNLFREIGGDAPAFQSIGRLELMGGDKDAIKDIATVQQIQQDKDAKGQVPPMSVAKMRIIGLDDAYGTAFSAMPQVAVETQDAARKIWQADAMRRDLDPTAPADKDISRAAQLAAGATFDGGTQYGGVGTHKLGWYSQKVPIPSGMKADEFTNAIRTLTDADMRALPNPPTTTTGQPISASQVQSGYLTAIPDRQDGIFRGAYRVSINDPNGPDPKWVMTPSGKPFTLDMGAAEPIIRARLPGAYRGTTP